MIIAVSVLIAEFTARNNGGAVRQESNPKSATTYISERKQLKLKLILTKKQNYENNKFNSNPDHTFIFVF